MQRSFALIACLACILAAAVGTALSASLLHAFDATAGFEGHMSESRPIGPRPNETGASIEVRIDTNVMPSLNWRLRAEQPVIHAEIGVPTIAFLDLVNRGDSVETARGLFSVTPDPASYHFMKADNFTTMNVSLDPDEAVRIPIAFYFDRTTTTDPEMTGIRAATVSYTF